LDQLIPADHAVLVHEEVFDHLERLGLERETAERRYEGWFVQASDDHSKAFHRSILGDGFGGEPLDHLGDGGFVLIGKGLEERDPHVPLQSVEPEAILGIRIVLGLAAKLLSVQPNDREITLAGKFGSVNRFALVGVSRDLFLNDLDRNPQQDLAVARAARVVLEVVPVLVEK
jgi:hypothetical protein